MIKELNGAQWFKRTKEIKRLPYGRYLVKTMNGNGGITIRVITSSLVRGGTKYYCAEGDSYWQIDGILEFIPLTESTRDAVLMLFPEKSEEKNDEEVDGEIVPDEEEEEPPFKASTPEQEKMFEQLRTIAGKVQEAEKLLGVTLSDEVKQPLISEVLEKTKNGEPLKRKQLEIVLGVMACVRSIARKSDESYVLNLDIDVDNNVRWVKEIALHASEALVELTKLSREQTRAMNFDDPELKEKRLTLHFLKNKLARISDLANSYCIEPKELSTWDTDIQRLIEILEAVKVLMNASNDAELESLWNDGYRRIGRTKQ